MFKKPIPYDLWIKRSAHPLDKWAQMQEDNILGKRLIYAQKTKNTKK
tara:strand:- start:655 stop:795 length:141 start_codon:yes stop_codon:yes gene_type:complete